MIYIISENQDLVTDLVVEWLVAREKDFKRYNDLDFIKSNTTINQTQDYTEEWKLATKVWQRRGQLNFLPEELFQNYSDRASILNYLSRESNNLNAYQEYKLKLKLKGNYIGSFQQEKHNNKLINLAVAKDLGFNVPNTIVTTEKKVLVRFYQKYAPIISKDLHAPVNISTTAYTLFSSGVKLVDDEVLDKLENKFAPVYAQQYVDKAYEARVFVFGSNLYSMGIFSQKDKQTQIDYRNYNKKRPNRCVPIKLPLEIEDRIWAFMRQSQMDTGSIDIIVTPSKEYYFLEINPMGQFHWLSQNCNYQIEKEIANFLCHEDH